MGKSMFNSDEERQQYLKEYRKNFYNKYYKDMKDKIYELLGDKCSSPECHTPGGETDRRCLQIDHVNGDGSRDRKKYKSIRDYYQAILANPNNYQILCANCNWIKRFENKEYKPWGKPIKVKTYSKLMFQQLKEETDFLIISARITLWVKNKVITVKESLEVFNSFKKLRSKYYESIGRFEPEFKYENYYKEYMKKV